MHSKLSNPNLIHRIDKKKHLPSNMSIRNKKNSSTDPNAKLLRIKEKTLSKQSKSEFAIEMNKGED